MGGSGALVRADGKSVSPSKLTAAVSHTIVGDANVTYKLPTWDHVDAASVRLHVQ